MDEGEWAEVSLKPAGAGGGVAGRQGHTGVQERHPSLDSFWLKGDFCWEESNLCFSHGWK